MQKFYSSAKWRKLRTYIRRKYKNTCQNCGRAGYLVHHIKPVTKFNVNDPNITLNEDNLMLLCLSCHNAIHGAGFIREDCEFDEQGNIVEKEYLNG